MKNLKAIGPIMLALALVFGLTLAVGCGGKGGDDNNASADDGGGDSNGGGGGDADPYALYKKEGRSWTIKNVTTMGDTETVSLMKTEVTAVTDEKATITTTMLNEDGSEMAPGTPTDIPFAAAGEGTGEAGDAPEMKEETITVEAGEFECYVTEAAGTKTWTSKKYPGLMVKSEGETTSSELIEFND